MKPAITSGLATLAPERHRRRHSRYAYLEEIEDIEERLESRSDSGPSLASRLRQRVSLTRLLARVLSTL